MIPFTALKISPCRLISVVIVLSIFISSCRKNDSFNQDIPPPYDSTVTFPGNDYTVLTDEQVKGIPMMDSFDLHSLLTSPVSDTPSLADFPPVGFQHQLHNSTNWAMEYGILGYEYQRQITGGYPSEFSPTFNYNQLNRDKDSGVAITDLLPWIRQAGMCPDVLFSSTDDFKTQPGQSLKDTALNFPVSEYFRIGSAELENIDLMIRLNYPVFIALKIDSAFEYAWKNTAYWSVSGSDPDTRYIWKNTGGKFLGIHAMVITGFDNRINAYRVQNSWGTTDWVPGGICWVDKNLLLSRLAGHDHYKQLFIGLPRMATLSNIIANQAGANASGTVYFWGFFKPVSTGVCWSEQREPDITDQNSVEVNSGAGDFSIVIPTAKLKPSTNYYCRSYVKDAYNRIQYGNQIAFTSPALPTYIITISSGNNQTGTIGKALTIPLKIMVLDDQQKPAPGINLYWNVNGKVGVWLKTEMDGTGTFSWNLGLNPGIQTLTVYASDSIGNVVWGSPVTFNATAILGADDFSFTSTLTDDSAGTYPSVPASLNFILHFENGMVTGIATNSNGGLNFPVTGTYNGGQINFTLAYVTYLRSNCSRGAPAMGALKNVYTVTGASNADHSNFSGTWIRTIDKSNPYLKCNSEKIDFADTGTISW